MIILIGFVAVLMVIVGLTNIIEIEKSKKVNKELKTLLDLQEQYSLLSMDPQFRKKVAEKIAEMNKYRNRVKPYSFIVRRCPQELKLNVI